MVYSIFFLFFFLNNGLNPFNVTRDVQRLGFEEFPELYFDGFHDVVCLGTLANKLCLLPGTGVFILRWCDFICTKVDSIQQMM